MNRFFRHPATNAVGISMFSLFYSILFLAFSDRIRSQTGSAVKAFWRLWDSFLVHGGHRYTAVVLMILTVLVVVILLLKHKPYDEYHTTILVKCLAVSVILTLAAIAIFFVVVLIDPTQIISKYTLFITINWSTVVLADLIYLLLCRRK